MEALNSIEDGTNYVWSWMLLRGAHKLLLFVMCKNVVAILFWAVPVLLSCVDAPLAVDLLLLTDVDMQD